MSESYPVPERVTAGSPSPVASRAAYLEAVAGATHDPSGFWLQQARQQLVWEKAPTIGLEGSFATVPDEPIRWFGDGRLNAAVNCVDRHLAARGDKLAIVWEGDEPGTTRTLTYRELHREVCRAANALEALGVRKGDRVVVYMGMVPEAAITMLACARLGAVHSVVFGGFSADSLRDRIVDCGARVVVTQDEGRRGGRPIPLKKVADEALVGIDEVHKVLVYRHTGAPVGWVEAVSYTHLTLPTSDLV